MMTEQQICELFISRRCLEAELAIINVCFKELVLADKAEYLSKYCLLERKIAVIDNLHKFLPDDEQFVIQKHLVEGILWSDISEMIYSDENSKLPYDKRSLQRIKAKAFIGYTNLFIAVLGITLIS